MTITRSIVEDGIIYTECNGIWIVGDNKTTAFYQNQVNTNVLVIPKEVRGHKIREIGVCAFREIKEIVSIFIEAEITQINHHAFSRCSRLSFINIPPTVNFIFNYGLFLGINDTTNSDSTVTILFEPSDKNISFFDRNLMSCKSLVIYYCRTSVPVYSGASIFGGVTTVKIYSPEDITLFGRSATVDSSRCFTKMRFNIKHNYCTVHCKKKESASHLFMFINQ